MALPESGLRFSHLRPVQLGETRAPLPHRPERLPAMLLGPGKHAFDVRPFPGLGADAGLHDGSAFPLLSGRSCSPLRFAGGYRSDWGVLDGAQPRFPALRPRLGLTAFDWQRV